MPAPSVNVLNQPAKRFAPLTKHPHRGLKSALTTSVCCGSHPIVCLYRTYRSQSLDRFLAVENIMAILNSTTPPTDFSPQEYQRLVEKYLTLSQQNDRLVRAIRAGTQVDIDRIRQALRTDFPLYARLQDYFSRLRARDLKSVDQIPVTSGHPVLGAIVGPSYPVDANMEGDAEMQLTSEHDPGAMSMFSDTTASVFAERSPAVPNRGPFAIRFSDFPPRVISQVLSAQSDVAASSCMCSLNSLSAYTHCSFLASWRGLFKWSGFEHVSRAKKFMRVPMIGMSATNGKDLYVRVTLRPTCVS